MIISALCPKSSEEICDIVKTSLASRSPISVIGTGSKIDWGHTVKHMIQISTKKFTGVTLYEPEELVVTAGSGTSISYIKSMLDENNQELAFEPPNLARLFGNSNGEGTLGGTMACNLAGPRRIFAGSARDHILGFEAVNGRGEIFKSGGRVVKNVTGFDLSKLMAGSFGTLGVMTTLSVKVLPKSEKSRSILVFNLSNEEAVLAMSKALSSAYEVNAAAHIPKKLSSRSSVPYVSSSGCAVTVIRIQGPSESISYRNNFLREELALFGDVEELHTKNSDQLWLEISDVVDLISDPKKLIWRICVAPSEANKIADRIEESCNIELYFDWGGGLIWLGIPPDQGPMDDFLRKLIPDDAGQATLLRAPKSVKEFTPVFHPQSDGLADLTLRIKHNFDPEHIINPGKMTINGRKNAD